MENFGVSATEVEPDIIKLYVNVSTERESSFIINNMRVSIKVEPTSGHALRIETQMLNKHKQIIIEWKSIQSLYMDDGTSINLNSYVNLKDIGMIVFKDGTQFVVLDSDRAKYKFTRSDTTDMYFILKKRKTKNR